MRNKFSIIVPIHNGQNYYESFLTSFKNCGLNDKVELIFVGNNNSLYEKILKEKLTELKINCKYFNYDDKKSSYGARNYGIKKSSGDFLIFVDIDISFSNDYMLKLNSIDFDHKTIYSGNISKFSKIKNKKTVAEKTDDLLFLNVEKMAKKKIGVTAHTIISRKIFDNLKFEEHKSGADIIFYNSVKNLNYNFKFLTELIVCHPLRNQKELFIKLKRVAKGLNESKRNIKILNLLLFLLPIWNIRFFKQIKFSPILHLNLYISHLYFRIWLLIS